jgi:hypothetical protein
LVQQALNGVLSKKIPVLHRFLYIRQENQRDELDKEFTIQGLLRGYQETVIALDFVNTIRPLLECFDGHCRRPSRHFPD